MLSFTFEVRNYDFCMCMYAAGVQGSACRGVERWSRCRIVSLLLFSFVHDTLAGRRSRTFLYDSFSYHSKSCRLAMHRAYRIANR